MTIPAVDSAYLVEFLVRLLNIPSPTGYTEKAIEFCEQAFAGLPLVLTHNRKGALIATWP